ncbi:MAG TPA: DEAD/DEAH box helicase family protein, partial [Rectinemataceae bacterium]|nr:DEAD/DEAH box helicase family protein [Rectinemataceae bacterium]
MTDSRSVQEEALGAIAKEETSAEGKLKIFFGMAAGVGKTYTMLKEARSLLDHREDLVIGWVESHGRAETDALLAGIEIVPPCFVTYRGVRFPEMDLDAVIKRSPSLVLVDELAHSNTPGMRHEKRWEDVLELLDSGISVWTTVNIQHLESWADSVELFTLVPVRERVPDSIFDRADEIQMIDIPPEELIHRLDEGKIYTGPASQDAVRNFFTKGNLGMLREIALRHASQMASQQLYETLRSEAPRGPSAAGQRILVAMSPSPNSQSLIRWARRLAYSIKMEWDCVYIENGVE